MCVYMCIYIFCYIYICFSALCLSSISIPAHVRSTQSPAPSVDAPPRPFTALPQLLLLLPFSDPDIIRLAPQELQIPAPAQANPRPGLPGRPRAARERPQQAGGLLRRPLSRGPASRGETARPRERPELVRVQRSYQGVGEEW